MATRRPSPDRTSRERILGRVRDALSGRRNEEHPGPFEGRRPDPPSGSAIEVFTANLQAADGEVVRTPDMAGAIAWLGRFAAGFDAVALGESVPADLRPSLPVAPPHEAPLSVSVARSAVAETGSLVMDARDGRRAQLLSPTHVVIVLGSTVFATLGEALASVRDDLPSAVGLHSGPSKSRDVGQVLVKGVHGPGRLVALLIEQG